MQRQNDFLLPSQTTYFLHTSPCAYKLTWAAWQDLDFNSMQMSSAQFYSWYSHHQSCTDAPPHPWSGRNRLLKIELWNIARTGLDNHQEVSSSRDGGEEKSVNQQEADSTILTFRNRLINQVSGVPKPQELLHCLLHTWPHKFDVLLH